MKIFKGVVNRSVVMPAVILTDDKCTLSVYETASNIYLLIEYIHDSKQKCVQSDLGKDGLSIAWDCTFFSDRVMATSLVSGRLNCFRAEADQSIELCVDKTILEVFFREMSNEKSITLGEILGDEPLSDKRIKFTIKGIENAFKSIGSPIVFKEPTEPSCTIS